MHARQGGELLVVKLLEGGQIAGYNVQQIVGIAKQPLCLHHLGNVHHGVFEGFNGAAIAFAHGDEHQSGKVIAQAAGIELGAVTPDHPRLL
ncbi:hypothetical protein AK51_24955 [Serratia nematodiphila DZ0503SBS1]|nr:hypothetical protein AK51_24955 [Serratia nematodiphila DZ0503SBS1]